MNTLRAPRTTILAAVARAPGFRRVIDLAMGIARAFPDTELHVLHVVDDSSMSAPVPRSLLLRRGRSFLARVAREASGIATFAHLESGPLAKTILAVANEISAGLVVVGAGHGVVRAGMGSVSTKVVHEARCPVLVARETDYPPTPAIEPPCPACLETRHGSHGESLWCARHAEHHVHGHTFAETPQTFGLGSSLIRPGS